MTPWWIRTKRYCRKAPGIALREFWDTLADRTQALGLIVSVIGLWLILLHASDLERDVQAQTWAVGVQAFALAAVVWAVICLVRGPFLARRQDRFAGTWHASDNGMRFVYYRPVLVAQERVIGTGEVERFKIKFEDAEPRSMVYYRIEVDNEILLPHIYLAVATGVALGSRGGRSVLKAGIRLPHDRTATLLAQIPEKFIAQTVRVFMRQFVVGEPEDRDGEQRRPDKAARTPT